MLLYRPVGLNELRLIAETHFRAFPPRLPDQPIFYPVLSLEYARQIAADWNTKAPPYIGFVTQFEVEDTIATRYPVQVAGSQKHRELWVPADELSDFNSLIIAPIRVLESYCGDQSSTSIAATTNLPTDWDQNVPYSPKTVDEVIATYSTSDERRIRFDWNGAHGDAFEDHNHSFRRDVLDEVTQKLEATPSLLIRDLFCALTAWSREAWAIDTRVRLLALTLLERSPKDFILDYLRGTMQSFDAYAATTIQDAPVGVLQACLSEIQTRLAQPLDDAELKLLKTGKDMFQSWLDAASGAA